MGHRFISPSMRFAFFEKVGASMEDRRLDHPPFSNETDRISQLPEEILDRILYFLPAKDAARTIFVSRMWWHVWKSLPEFSFTSDSLPHKENLFKQDGSLNDEADEYMDSIDTSLEKLRHRKVWIERFRLDLFEGHERHASRFNQFLELANKNYIWELVIQGLVSSDPSPKKPSLPLATFSSINMFEVLDLKNCVLRPELLKHGPRFPDLRKLCLYRVKLSRDNMVENLLENSPFLKEFSLESCGVKRVNLCDHPTLNKVRIVGVGMIWVKAKNVEIFSCNYRGVKRLKLHFDSCDNLKLLSLTSNLAAPFIQELIARSPVLDILYLQPRIPLVGIKIYSLSIKHIFLYAYHTFGAKEAEIDAPNLRFYHCQVETGAAATSTIFMNNTAKLEIAELAVKIGTSYLPTNQWFIHVKNCLESFKYNALKIEVVPDTTNMDLVLENLRQVSAAPPVYIGSVVYLELLSVFCHQSSFDFSALFDCCFSICRPKQIHIYSSSCRFNFDFINLLRDKLIPWEENPECCRNAERKCWRHYLGDVEIKNPQCCRNSERICWQHYLYGFEDIRSDMVVRLNLKWKMSGQKRKILSATTQLFVDAANSIFHCCS